MAPHERTLYERFGVGETISAAQLKKRWKALSKEFHPDHASESERAQKEKKFQELSEAWQTLRDEHRRAVYDAKLRDQRGQSQKTAEKRARRYQESSARQAARRRREEAAAAEEARRKEEEKRVQIEREAEERARAARLAEERAQRDRTERDRRAAEDAARSAERAAVQRADAERRQAARAKLPFRLALHLIGALALGRTSLWLFFDTLTTLNLTKQVDLYWTLLFFTGGLAAVTFFSWAVHRALTLSKPPAGDVVISFLLIPGGVWLALTPLHRDFGPPILVTGSGERFAVYSDFVVDRSLHLIWQRGFQTGQSPAQAKASCRTLPWQSRLPDVVFGWRLPSPVELQSLVPISRAAFPGTPTGPARPVPPRTQLESDLTGGHVSAVGPCFLSSLSRSNGCLRLDSFTCVELGRGDIYNIYEDGREFARCVR